MPSSRKPRSSRSKEVHPSVAAYRQKERGERLQKVLADAGVAARRECERLIVEGAVTVNGKTIDMLPAWVDPEEDRIEVFGRPLRRAEKHVYIMLFKPRGTVCTNSDPEGRPRAIDLVDHPARTRLYCVGRLDLDASGLLILTNDGEFANRLTHPRYEVPKGYELTLDGRLDAESIAALERKLLGKSARRAAGAEDAPTSSLTLVSVEQGKSLVHLELCEHRNLQVKELMHSLGHPVRKMRRTSFGPLLLKGLAVGEWRELTKRELDMLRKGARKSAPKPRTAREVAPKPVVGRGTAGATRTATTRAGDGRMGEGRMGDGRMGDGRMGGTTPTRSSTRDAAGRAPRETARGTVRKDARGGARKDARGAGHGASRGTAKGTARGTARATTRGESRGESRGNGGGAARGAARKESRGPAKRGASRGGPRR